MMWLIIISTFYEYVAQVGTWNQAGSIFWDMRQTVNYVDGIKCTVYCLKVAHILSKYSHFLR